MSLRNLFSKPRDRSTPAKVVTNKNVRFVTGVSHINIGVPDIDRAIDFYKSFLGAEPQRIFSHFKNQGFAQSAGFLDSPEDVDVSIAFLDIPGAQLTLELMEYHSPAPNYEIKPLQVNDICGVRHVALRVNDIDLAFENAKNESGVRMIQPHPKYKAFTISKTDADQFLLFDPVQESDRKLKHSIAADVGKIRYFYCVDPYGVQWEFEQGNTGIGH